MFGRIDFMLQNFMVFDKEEFPGMGSHQKNGLSSTKRRLMVALAVTLSFVAIETVGGVSANSLALLTDALHNFSDAFALGLSWWALRLSSRPANNARTFGYHRAGILVALLNAATLIGLSLVAAFEAIQRFGAPPGVREQTIILVGALGFTINAGIAWSLRRPSRGDLNIRSAFVHMAGDALSTLGVVAAGVGIALLGWNWLDPLASILIAALILWSAWGIVRETVDILLESAPPDLDVEVMVRDIMNTDGVTGVHDLHVWRLASNLRMLSAHVLTNNMTISEGAQVQHDINNLLLNRYGIGHTALQLEYTGCEPDLLYCDLSPEAASQINAERRQQQENARTATK
jgi:cobalt-zinc-cadmium efflux system protein